MSTLKISAVFLFAWLYLTPAVEGFPAGAPAMACDSLTPNPIGHGAQPQTTPVPYSIDLSALNNSGVWEYTPGQRYTLTVSGDSDETFRGFFVQSRLVADDTTRVGSFSVIDTTNSQLSACSPSNVGVTHTNADNKTSVSFWWTGPPAGTGNIRFGFAVVQVRNTYWANQRTDIVIGEADSGARRNFGVGFFTILILALTLALREMF